MVSGFTQFHNSNLTLSVGRKMQNKCRCSVNYILVKNIRSSGNSIIQYWISMLLTGICGATAGAVVLWINGSTGMHKCKLFRWNSMTRFTAIVTSLLYSKKNTVAVICEGVFV